MNFWKSIDIDNIISDSIGEKIKDDIKKIVLPDEKIHNISRLKDNYNEILGSKLFLTGNDILFYKNTVKKINRVELVYYCKDYIMTTMSDPEDGRKLLISMLSPGDSSILIVLWLRYITENISY